ncbi:MAG: hypothetical protein M3N95_06330 [Actinomycetota bacterium]|nr:hypothetical protein [Actinomycetota bacterium]
MAGSLTINLARGRAVFACDHIRPIARPRPDGPSGGPYLVRVEQDVDDDQLPWPDNLDARTKTFGPWVVEAPTPLQAMTNLVDQLTRDQHQIAPRLQQHILDQTIEHSRPALSGPSTPVQL